MKTNDERVTFPFESEVSGTPRFRIKLSRPGTRKLAATATHTNSPADTGSHAGDLFPPQSPTTPFAADGVKAASTMTGPTSTILPKELSRYVFFAVCICIAAAAFGASAGYYIVSFSSPSPMFQTPSRPNRPDSVSQHEPTASEKMALKIAEMRKIAAEESESTDTAMGDTKANSSINFSGSSPAPPKESGTGALIVPNTSPAPQCSAASLALALCGDK